LLTLRRPQLSLAPLFMPLHLVFWLVRNPAAVVVLGAAAFLGLRYLKANEFVVREWLEVHVHHVHPVLARMNRIGREADAVVSSWFQ